MSASKDIFQDVERTLAGISLYDDTDWPEPQPMPEGLPSVAPFDEALLPSILRPWIMDIAERIQCPPDFPAVGAMVALAAIVGRKIGIRPKRRDDWLVIPNLWGAIIGRPGIMKTPALQEPLKPLRRMEAEAAKEHKALLRQHQAAYLIASEQRKVARDKIRKALKTGGDASEQADALMADGQDEPTRKRYMANDASVEKLGEILNENPNGVLVFRDELVGLLKSLDKEGQEGARTFYLEAWNGTGSYTYDRIGRGTVEIEAACVSVLGGIQPGPLAEYLRSAASGGAGDDGLMQRFQLAVYPDIAKDWRNVDQWPDSTAKQAAYDLFQRLHALDPASVAAQGDPDDGPPFLRFDEAAQGLFNEWRDELEHKLRRGTEHPILEGHLSKYRSLIPSLALLIHLADKSSGPVSEQALLAACAWGDYLESHARRIYGPALLPDTVAGKALAHRIQTGDLADGFALRDIYRNGWQSLATREDAERAVNVLLDLDWLRESVEATLGRHKTRYWINPRLEVRA